MKRTRFSALLGLLISLLALVVGCAPSGGAVKGEADFTGEVTDVQHIGRGDVLGSVLAEEKVVTQDGEYLDKYVLTVKSDTAIFDERGGDRRSATFEALAVGQRVQVWFSGPVKESYPMQVDAGQIVIVK